MLPNYVLKQAPENVVIGAGSLATAGNAPAGTTFVRLCATSACHYKFGGAAAITDRLLPAGVVEFVPCAAGLNVNVIQDAAAGVLNVAFCDGI